MFSLLALGGFLIWLVWMLGSGSRVQHEALLSTAEARLPSFDQRHTPLPPLVGKTLLRHSGGAAFLHGVFMVLY